MRTSRVVLLPGLVLALAAATAMGQVVVIDFDSPDGGGPLANGQAIDESTPLPFIQIGAVPSEDNLGNAIFDSDPDGPNVDAMDQDLLVDSGHILILQNPNFPEQTDPGIYDLPNDAFHGGVTLITFLPEDGVRLISIDIIDLDMAEAVILTATDIAGETTVISLPENFTGNGGQATVDFDIEGTGGGLVNIVSLEIDRMGSGAADNLVFEVGDGGMKCNADNMCDDGILCTADLCIDGACVNEPIPGCESCENTTLILETSSGVIGPGEVLTVDVVMSCAPLPVVGAQFFLAYDPFDLTFISAVPGDPPFEIEILEEVDGVHGLIDYAVHIPFDGSAEGATEPTVLATLTFAATNDCGQTEILWRDNNPPTRLTLEGGEELVPRCQDAQVRVACPTSIGGEEGDEPPPSRVKARRLRRTFLPWTSFGRTDPE